ncbi:DUF4157 domain-containing protein [Caldilinea sp.]|uniref:eCIS core domain-containing protein n=1 Tax=Caldilinea sp. TaxID=2293560 RepID=UPI002C98BC56|nr:DUF4157 domain-containing protein [Caldilinea sp.]
MSKKYAVSSTPANAPARLKIGAPGDRYEQAADHAARRVMRMAAPSRPDAGTDQQATPQVDPPQQGFDLLHAQGDASGQREQASAPVVVQEVLQTPGQSLDAAARRFMEPRFGHNFAHVRVHADAGAASSAHSVHARAYAVGRHIVFGAGQYAPNANSGRRLLAHELAHVLQAPAGTRLARAPEEERVEPPVAETATPVMEAPAAEAETATDAAAAARSATSQPTAATAATPAVTPGGHTSAPASMVTCPDAPPRTIVVVGCAMTPAAAPPTAEKAVLPTPDPARFGGDADRAKFAKELAQCRAERDVKDEIEKRYRADVAAAKKQATAESKVDAEAAIQTATEGLDPKEKRAIRRAKAQASADAKKAAAKKIADAQAAVTRQDVAAVTKELATKYEDELAADYDATIAGALARYGPGWRKTMQSRLDKERKRITKEKRARPKVAKGETPPPAKSSDAIAAEIEAEMVQVRCDQSEWARNQLEDVAHGWAVGRREEVDFRTIPQKAGYLKGFKPTYDVASTNLVDIPAGVQTQKNMPGVAPELADFLTQLAADPATPGFTAGNYAGHGGGSWAGKGFSTDLFLKAPRDPRGFWEHATAVDFLLALDATAKALGARWRVLYNDFGVAQEVNRATGSRNVEFVGSSGGGKLNWHGPAPLILHFHLDLEIPQKKPAAGVKP